MTAHPLFDPVAAGRPMRVAAFMSGSGTNIIKLLEHERRLWDREGASPFEVAIIFSDRSDGGSRGEAIALDHALPYCSYDIRAFHAQRSLKRSVKTPEGLKARRTYDQVAKRLVAAFDVDVIALGGYMSYVTLNRCVNVHPADLSILDEQGNRKYVGDHAVRDAILAGEKTLRASTLWTDEGVDTGPLLMVSKPVPVELPKPVDRVVEYKVRFQEVVDAHQERLKEAGDWRIFPRSIELIARGRFSLDHKGRIFLDGKPVPGGYREEEVEKIRR